MLDIEHLERSFAKIKDRGPEFTAAFYKTLFTNCPEVKPLFQQVDMQEQGKNYSRRWHSWSLACAIPKP